MVFSAARSDVEASRQLAPFPLGRGSNDANQLHGSNMLAQVWYDDVTDDIAEYEAERELREVLGHKGGHARMPGYAGPGACLSAGSTTATTPPRLCTPPPPSSSPFGTPPPPVSSPPPSTNCSETQAWDASDSSPAHWQASRNRGNPQEKDSFKLSRKVFVGGIPQTIDQNSLCAMFNEIGKMDKGWLQWQHDAEGRPMQKHRGFGFVIFRDARTIDHLFGQELSKYIWFGNSLKLEIKRAFGKTDVAYSTPPADHHQGRNPKHKLYGMQSPLPSPPPAWQSNSSPTSPNSWMSHQWLYPNSPGAGVPPFPCMESLAMEPSQSRGTPMTTPSTVSFPSLPPTPSHSESTTKALLAAFLGPQQPRDGLELAQMLRAALPDHYED